ncbi:MAG: hypothetical protein OXR62_13935 [Ahrensia sp.]|nr:hypothetical protein [Ahrensia sp.]
MGYWDEVKRTWGAMADGDFTSATDFGGRKRRTGTGSGHGGTGNGRRGTGNGYGSSGHPSYDELRLIHRKFRKHFGRDPYSLRELEDWWDRL